MQILEKYFFHVLLKQSKQIFAYEHHPISNILCVLRVSKNGYSFQCCPLQKPHIFKFMLAFVHWNNISLFRFGLDVLYLKATC